MKGLAKGQYVKHAVFGCGVIIESDPERTAIDFDLHGNKKFVTGLLTVEPAEGTPPERPIRKRAAKAPAVSTAAAADKATK